MVATTVRRCCCESARRMPTTSAAILASRPLVGSSHSSTAGLVSSSSPIETRLRCPPERPRASTEPMRVRWSSPSKLSSESTLCTRASLAARPSARGSFRCAAYTSISRGDSPASSTSSCGTVTMSLRVAVVYGAPSIAIDPMLQRPPRRMERSVVLPAPDGPMSAVKLPGEKVASTSERMVRAAPRTLTVWPTPEALSSTPASLMAGTLPPSTWSASSPWCWCIPGLTTAANCSCEVRRSHVKSSQVKSKILCSVHTNGPL